MIIIRKEKRKKTEKKRKKKRQEGNTTVFFYYLAVKCVFYDTLDIIKEYFNVKNYTCVICDTLGGIYV